MLLVPTFFTVDVRLKLRMKIPFCNLVFLANNVMFLSAVGVFLPRRFRVRSDLETAFLGEREQKAPR